ncbi:MAG: UbiX family flavin prenyltransferase [Deltaproteobacteria bacterium]|nr:UbiX family flavin prenyltransferase [Deltaproteobacteria bacterium]
MKKIILAITGASGSLYAVEFVKLLENMDVEVHGIVSRAGEKVLSLEQRLTPAGLPGVRKWYGIDNLAAPMASGSARYDAMVVLPCTMGTLAAIANGLSINLIHRAADVMLKERKPLVLAVRETPFNRNHLQNMLAASEAGAIICPAMPAFYHLPENLTDMARHFAGRVAAQIGLRVAGLKEWSGIDV